MKSHGLSHIQLTVADLERSVRFYESVLGLRKKWDGDADTAFLTTPGCHDIITLNAGGDRSKVGELGGIAHFGFHVDSRADFDQALRRASEAGGSVIRSGLRKTPECPEEPWAFLSDPDGYRVEIYCPTPG